jgi:hypothetical protein
MVGFLFDFIFLSLYPRNMTHEIVNQLHRLSMAVQGEVPADVVDEGLREHLIREEWKKKVPNLLGVITDPAHRYYGRVGQLQWPAHDFFVGTEEGHRVGAMKAAAEGERKFGFCLTIDMALVTVPEEALFLIDKGDVSSLGIRIVDEEGREGLLLKWKPLDGNKAKGEYLAQFGERLVVSEDYLMMQDPTWEFSLTHEKIKELQEK